MHKCFHASFPFFCLCPPSTCTRGHTDFLSHTLGILFPEYSVTHLLSRPYSHPAERIDASHTRCLTPTPAVFAIDWQEPRTRHPLPDHAWFRPGHSHRSGSLPAAEKRSEQADDRRVLGEQQAAIQQGCSRVSPVYFCQHAHRKYTVYMINTESL